MKYRILLVNAPVLSVLEPWFDAPEFVRTSLAFLAGYLRQYGDFEIRCFDAKFERKSFYETADQIALWKPDLVGFSAFTNEIKPSAYLAGLVKKRMPAVVTVIGGPHVTAIPTQTIRQFPTFDIGVVGEGEETILELCNALCNKQPLDKIKGLVYRNDQGEIILNPQRPRILEPDKLPMPVPACPWRLTARLRSRVAYTKMQAALMRAPRRSGRRFQSRLFRPLLKIRALPSRVRASSNTQPY